MVGNESTYTTLPAAPQKSRAPSEVVLLHGEKVECVIFATLVGNNQIARNVHTYDQSFAAQWAAKDVHSPHTPRAV